MDDRARPRIPLDPRERELVQFLARHHPDEVRVEEEMDQEIQRYGGRLLEAGVIERQESEQTVNADGREVRCVAVYRLHPEFLQDLGGGGDPDSN
ncbi:MAG: hypothetical protein ACXVRN_14935 [Solirubrobacteraceae bacterium]